MITRFRTRLIIILAGLVAGALLVALAAVWVATENQLERSIERELSVSEKVFRELLDSRSTQLLQAAEVLTDDFGFKRAVSSKDRETIISALVNHGERIEAELMVLQTPDGKEIASSHAFDELRINPRAAGSNRELAVVEDELFQLVTVPVNAPNLIAWATLGFEVDSELAEELKSLANADISLWLESSNDVLASSLSQPKVSSLSETLTQSNGILDAWLLNNDFAGNEVILNLDSGDAVHVVLTTSLSAATEEFTRLRWQIVLIAIAALVVAMLLAVIIARGVSRPLQQLSGAAKKLQQGDYSETNLSLNDDEFGKLADTFGSMRKAISEREQRISYQASHDHLTNLPNRRFFRKELEKLLHANNSGCLLLLNIRQFRVLNDSVGQEIGDDILRQLSDRLRQCCANSTLLARVGGDEFAILYSFEQLAFELNSNVNQLEAFLKSPFKVGDSDYRLAFNLGVVCFPEQGAEVDLLIRRAQVSVQQAKLQQSFYVEYQQGLDEQHMRRLQIIESLKDAVKDEELHLVLQPKINCQSGTVVGAEVLLRWQSEKLGFVGPDEFIPLAEQSGAITDLTDWVCRQSVELLRNWEQQGKTLKLSINLSTVDLLSDALPLLFEQLIKGFPQLPQRLVLEVTESAVMQDPEKAIARLETLKRLGFSISIDDYGTGHSSLAQLRRLPVEELKVDRAFVQYLSEEAMDESIVRSTIQLAHELGLRVVAEGVEDEASWKVLQSLQCDELQGYYFSKPLAISDFKNYLTEHELKE
ncbi:EAL domain-containing protein [Idiomarina abyssalis]|uniref:EAL domain-containing protein n=1 Tax=Idiomarina abyssalis TaxID=86102 RepID=A0A8I1GAE8_9GAMM|nr:EAL domain-containing protein [Idiomarina abyssalis]MBJ7267404.1 EAL domain-containing protein [Idiomarina abyssalis]MBJ7273333.1 EAL domain-containing protein [Idiomarina abyssalis]MBJ7315087.1 EAL domain-containing protein [Idiomarina abyssalis]